MFIVVTFDERTILIEERNRLLDRYCCKSKRVSSNNLKQQRNQGGPRERERARERESGKRRKRKEGATRIMNVDNEMLAGEFFCILLPNPY